MRILLFILLLFPGLISCAQNNKIIKLAFADTSNFDITAKFFHNKPAVYYVLDTTDKWNTRRFHLDEDLSSESVRKRLINEEHSYYHNYIFRDSIMDKLFPKEEKAYLYYKAKSSTQRKLRGSNSLSLIKSFNDAQPGFFFSVTDPVFSSNRQYAFLDITVFWKNELTHVLNDAYYGAILLVYKKTNNGGWTRIRKYGRLIL